MTGLTYNGKEFKIYRLKSDGTEVVKDTCSRCGGTGHYSFNPSDGTRCFGCSGSGTQLVKVSTIKNRIKREASLIKQREKNGGLTNAELKKVKEAEARLEAEREANHGLTDHEVSEMISFCVENKRLKKARASQHVGNVGEKVEVTGQVQFFKWCDTRFGTSALVITRDAGGNVVKFFSSGKAGDVVAEAWGHYKEIPEEGSPEITFTGTVKDHGEYKDERNTTLTRVKVG